MVYLPVEVNVMVDDESGAHDRIPRTLELAPSAYWTR
jgi:hypothetical protein